MTKHTDSTRKLLKEYPYMKPSRSDGEALKMMIDNMHPRDVERLFEITDAMHERLEMNKAKLRHDHTQAIIPAMCDCRYCDDE